MTRTTLATILIASVAGAAAGVLTTTFLPKNSFESPVAASSEDGRVAKLEHENTELERAIKDLRDGQALLASRGERVSVRGESASADGALVSVPANGNTSAEPNAAAEPTLTVDLALAQLFDPNLSYEDRKEIWEKVNKAGLLDSIVDAMEKRAEREPNNPKLKVDLGNAYLQEVFAASAMAKGKWAMKADAAFDAALEIDPQHWEARFTKAVSLSNWPAFLGKQPQAIGEFETLVSQQNAGPQKPEYAHTYLYLGSMYQSTGSMAKAIETFQKGCDLFPDNAELKQHLADAKKL